MDMRVRLNVLKCRASVTYARAIHARRECINCVAVCLTAGVFFFFFLGTATATLCLPCLAPR
jgi:hypothetical protein